MYLKHVKPISFAIVAMLSGKIGKVTTEQQVLYVSQVDILSRLIVLPPVPVGVGQQNIAGNRDGGK